MSPWLMANTFVFFDKFYAIWRMLSSFGFILQDQLSKRERDKEKKRDCWKSISIHLIDFQSGLYKLLMGLNRISKMEFTWKRKNHVLQNNITLPDNTATER